METIFEFLRNNAIWLIPVSVALISGIFGLIKFLVKKQSVYSKQSASNIINSNVNQVAGDQNIK